MRIGPNRREVLDWPPSPARLHEALLSATLVGLPRPDTEQEKVWTAFKWFETLPPPIILASAQDENLRTAPRLAIPQDNPNKARLHEHSILLAPTQKAVALTDAPLEVVYQWELESELLTENFEILKDAAARISYLGRGEDRAEVSLSLADEPPPFPLVHWLPDESGDTELWASQTGTTAGLKERHLTIVPPRETRKPAQRWMRLVRYSDDAPRAMQPISTAIFQLFPDNDNPDTKPLDCDPQNGGLWREFFRHIVCDMAKNASYWDDPAFAAELLSGHCASNSKDGNPHIAIVPLPSLNASNTADGRIRRIALLGYASSERQATAREIYETVFNALDGHLSPGHTPITQKGEKTPVRIVRCDVSSDKIWRYLTAKSRVWESVIPVAVARHFKVPLFRADGKTELSLNERHLRRCEEIVKLLRDSLKHIGVPVALAETCRIEVTPSPLILHTHRAEQYRPPGEKAFMSHARIEFPCRVRGPLLLGDRRHFGLGLFAAVPEGRTAQKGE